MSEDAEVKNDAVAAEEKTDDAVDESKPTADEEEKPAPAKKGKASKKSPKPAAAESPKKKTKENKKKWKQAPANHPHYRDMIKDALTNMKERGGSSRQAILKYIMGNYSINVDEKAANNHLKMALRAGVKNGTLLQSKGQGASGSFRLGEGKTSNKKKATPSKKSAAPKEKAAKSPKKTKKASPKKAAKKAKDSKKAKAKSPKKKAAGAKKGKAKAKAAKSEGSKDE